jgi:hypothetical protein
MVCSYGKCEICEETRVCFDVPSSQLPELEKVELHAIILVTNEPRHMRTLIKAGVDIEIEPQDQRILDFIGAPVGEDKGWEFENTEWSQYVQQSESLLGHLARLEELPGYKENCEKDVGYNAHNFEVIDYHRVAKWQGYFEIAETFLRVGDCTTRCLIVPKTGMMDILLSGTPAVIWEDIDDSSSVVVSLGGFAAGLPQKP